MSILAATISEATFDLHGAYYPAVMTYHDADNGHFVVTMRPVSDDPRLNGLEVTIDSADLIELLSTVMVPQPQHDDRRTTRSAFADLREQRDGLEKIVSSLHEHQVLDARRAMPTSRPRRAMTGGRKRRDARRPSCCTSPIDGAGWCRTGKARGRWFAREHRRVFPGKHGGGYLRNLWTQKKRLAAAEMGKVTFILDTSADTLAAWLLANWRAPHGASETGSLQGQSLRESRQSSGARVLTADVIWVSHQHDEEGRAQAQPLREAFRFRLQPLAAQRVEVTAECLFHYGLLGELARLLEDIARRWPELRDTLEHSPDYWDFDSFPPENETQQTLLDAFTARLERLKERNVKPLALQGANACGAVFYLDNTTAREAATWLAENWRRRNYEPNVWTWTTDYHHARRYKTTPLQEATDGHGRALLTVGMVEWETHHPNPLSVPFGPLAIPQDQGFIVQDNPRGLEILLIQAGSDLVQVEARCNALLLLHSFTQLLRSAKTAYGDRLRNIAPTFGVMDAAPPRTHAMMDAYFTARADEFCDLVIEIEPKYARLLG